jgi:alpha,alpha-trehalase
MIKRFPIPKSKCSTRPDDFIFNFKQVAGTGIIRMIKSTLFLLSILLFISCTPKSEKVVIGTPEELYGQLFFDIQSNENIFPDCKTFVDCVPMYNPEIIREKYSDLKNRSDSSVRTFLRDNFIIPGNESYYIPDSSSINEHISRLWNVLKRSPDKVRSGTLIPLPYPYIVPGGRFREIYYWDSYFTMLGLKEDRHIELIENMVKNFSYLIEKYGYIPNGNRTYYLGRSQPPFYSLMISLLSDIKGDTVFTHYLKYMEKEYEFWMDGTDKLVAPINEFRRVVRLNDGEILNRYWDDKNIPRSESYREDIKTAEEAALRIPGLDKKEVFRNLRASAESGWDFSCRWLSSDSAGNYKLYTIHTTDIIPVDLNSLLYNLEYVLSKSYKLAGNDQKAAFFKSQFESRQKAIIKYCWNQKKGFFMDYNFKKADQTQILSLAGVYPLFCRIANNKQAMEVSKNIEVNFLKSGGVVPTLNNTGQQWDAPNGWAPLLWITISGLENYGINDIAGVIRSRWLALNKKVYRSTFKMLEKYNVEDTTKKGGGGEYPNQDGFGWTNGVYQKLSHEIQITEIEHSGLKNQASSSAAALK